MRRLLLIAYHFPPIQGSTGTTRTLAFARYLAKLGWETQVLTVHPRAYLNADRRNMILVPDNLVVHRAQAWNTQKHLSIRKKYLRILALPDEWQTWILGGLFRGIGVVRQWNPDAIMSTFPIATAHGLGYLLSRITGKPWLAELRDPMLQDNYPKDALIRRSYSFLERKMGNHACAIVTTTPSCRETYLKRFPSFSPDRIRLIQNGYDPAMFPQAPFNALDQQSGPLRVLHSGVLYPEDRNPIELFNAIAELRDAGALHENELKISLRASGSEQVYQRQVNNLRLSDIVELLPAIPYQQALREMMHTDVNMLLQGATCDEQIPAKAYEYIYAKRPILGLVNPSGDSGKLLKEIGQSSIAPLEDRSKIKAVLLELIQRKRIDGKIESPDYDPTPYSREESASKLSILLDEVVRTA